MHSMESMVARAEAEIRADAKNLRKEVRGDVEGAYCIYVAGKQARLYAVDAMAQETGYQFETLKAGFLPGLLYTLKVVGATTAFGAGVGGLVGFFGGAGAGAAPGIVVGGEIGFEVATAALSWAGLGFLVVEIAEGFDELYETLHDGVEWAWEARYAQGGAQHDQLDRAAHKIAKAAGIVVRLALQGILAWLLKKGAMSSTRRALTVGGRIGTQGIGAAADASVAELVAKIRVSKLGPDFAKWVEDHWEDLKNNPKLKPKAASSAGGGSGGGPSGGSNSGGNSGGQDGTGGKSAKSGAGASSQAAADAEKIANGHAYTKHAQEFGNITKDQFKQLVQDTMENPSDSRTLSNGRTAYWNDAKQMVVIKNPNAVDGGTAFIPTGGKTYFNNLR